MNKLFNSPRLDLSVHTYVELYYGEHRSFYKDIIPQVVMKCKSNCMAQDYENDIRGEKFARRIYSEARNIKDLLLLAVVGCSHAPAIISKINDEFNIRYYSPNDENAIDPTLEHPIGLNLERLATHKLFELSCGAYYDVLDKIFPDNPARSYAVIIGDKHFNPNNAIAHLEKASTLKNGGIKKVLVALEGYHISKTYTLDNLPADMGYDGKISPIMSSLIPYLKTIQKEDIEIDLFPIDDFL